MKRIVNAHLTIPIEVDENGMINLLNEYTQTYITAFSGELKPRDNMYQKIMDFLKQSELSVPEPVSDPLTDPVDNAIYMVLKKSGIKVRKPSESQTFKYYGNKTGSNQWTRKYR